VGVIGREKAEERAREREKEIERGVEREGGREGGREGERERGGGGESGRDEPAARSEYPEAMLAEGGWFMVHGPPVKIRHVPPSRPQRSLRRTGVPHAGAQVEEGDVSFAG
jgi:hypothetical protein